MDLRTPLAHERSDVVGELAHAQPHVVEDVDPLQPVGEGSGVLEVDHETEPVFAVGPLDVAGLENEQHPVVQRIHDGPRLGDAGDGRLEGLVDRTRPCIGSACYVDSRGGPEIQVLLPRLRRGLYLAGRHRLQHRRRLSPSHPTRMKLVQRLAHALGEQEAAGRGRLLTVDHQRLPVELPRLLGTEHRTPYPLSYSHRLPPCREVYTPISSRRSSSMPKWWAISWTTVILISSTTSCSFEQTCSMALWKRVILSGRTMS